LQPVLGWLTSAGLAFKKVDSLLRGNTFAEIAWIYREGGFDQVVFAPAFPAQGRITRENRQQVVAADGTRQPVAEPLREAFGRFGLDIAASPEAVGDVWIPEVTTDADLDRIAACSRVDDGRKRLWCGSAGLAHAFSRLAGVAPCAGEALPPAKGLGPTVLISSSFQPVFREQWAALRSGSTSSVVAEQGDDRQIDEALLAAHNGAEHVWFDLSPRRQITPDEAARLLAGYVHRLVDRLPIPGQLLVVGGDTLLGLCRETRTEILLTQPSLRSGWGCARLVGGRWDGVPCHSRSGAFGVRED
ncbi:MAG: four-carbon acid sugar kinase family protein, partial [Propionivibrio sp.]